MAPVFVRALVLVALGLGIAGTATAAQQRLRPPARYLELKRPDAAEGRRILDSMRDVGLAGPYYLEFEMRILPRRDDERRVPGRWFGARNAQGPVTRIELSPAPDKSESWLIQSGPEPGVWRVTPGEPPERLEAAAAWEPLAGTNFTAVDLQTPFMYWEDFVYEGLTRFRSRPTYVFLLYPPAERADQWPGVGGARVFIDAQFKALLQVQWVDAAGQALKTITILDFKEVDDQWIPKSFEARDERTRDKTRFVVTAAALQVEFDPAVFAHEAPARAVDYEPTADRLVRMR